jgi:hypothetical protein
LGGHPLQFDSRAKMQYGLAGPPGFEERLTQTGAILELAWALTCRDPQFLKRGFAFAAKPERYSQQVARPGEIRIDPERFAKVLPRFLRPLQYAEEKPDFALHFGRLRGELGGFLVYSKGARGIAPGFIRGPFAKPVWKRLRGGGNRQHHD